MNKKKIKVILIIILSFILTGCWSYRGMNEITVVTGFAVDKGENNTFHVTFEIVDLTKTGEDKIITPSVVESEGETIFDAARNAKKRINNKLYFGNAQVIVVSNQIASEDGLSKILDWFIRDAEPRETMSLVISQEKTAKELLVHKGLGHPLLSLELKDILDEDQNITLSTKNTEIYKTCSTIKSKGVSLTMAAIHLVENNKELVNETNGIGVFKKDKLIGYLDPDKTKYFLFVINEVNGGLINMKANIDNKELALSFEIFKSKTKVSYEYKNEKIKIFIKPELKVAIAEKEKYKKTFSEKTIKKITKELQTFLTYKIKDVVKNVQDKYASDIFAFGNMIYRSNPKLWKKLSANWDNIFKNLDVKVDSKVTIINTAYTK